MAKTILYASLSLVLSFSILGPSIMKLYDSDLGEIVFLDTSEEEQQKKTSSEIDDFKTFEKSQLDLGALNKQKDKLLSNYNRTIVSADNLEIQLPPPRHKI
jgi:hypothetical protein